MKAVARDHAGGVQPPAEIAANPRAAKLAFEVALRYFTPEELMLQFGLHQAAYEQLIAAPQFQRAVQAYRREIDETGQDFRIKARKSAFILLDELVSIAMDPSAEPKERIDAAREVSRLAGYGQKEEGAASGNTTAFQLNINLPGTHS